jgi:hypothetical protein
MAAGVEVIHGVDATQLPRGLGTVLDWSKVEHIVWNFPLVNPACYNTNSSIGAAGEPAAAGGGGGGMKLLGDDEEANRQLLGEALAAISRVIMARNGAIRVRVRGGGGGKGIC